MILLYGKLVYILFVSVSAKLSPFVEKNLIRQDGFCKIRLLVRTGRKSTKYGYFPRYFHGCIPENIVTIHRLIVLEHYARNVAKKYPYMNKEVMTFFWKYVKELEKRKIDKDCSSLVINIAKKILELYRMLDY